MFFSHPGNNADPILETKKDYLKDIFNKLKNELKCPPRPDAVCKYSECLKINQDNHIIPSEKIYKDDPDFKPFYRIFCTSTCILDYHDCCWSALKLEISKEKGFKAPTEKDFCGKNCFTPDCEGIIIKCHIVDRMEFKLIENKKVTEQLELEEKSKREAEKLRKAGELKKQQLKKLEARANNPKKKERSRSKSVASESSDNKSEGNNGTSNNDKDNNNDNEIVNPYENLPDLSKVPMTILKKRDKDNDNDDENLDNKKKEKKKKEKATLSLGEFVGTTEVNGGNDEYANRIEKLAALKKTHENYDPGAGSYTNSASERNLNPNARSFNPVTSRINVGESIKTFVYEQLSKLGPMKDTDIRLTKDLGADAKQIINDGNGLLQLLKSDERFGSYSNYLCLKGDAEKAKKLKDEDDKKLQEAKNSAPQTNGNLGDTARKLKELLVKEKTPPEVRENGFGLKNVSEEPSLLERINKDACVKPPTVGAGQSFRTEGVQTDVSSINVDTDDPYVLQQQNDLLSDELVTANDKLAKLQNKAKLENREQSDQIATLESEKLVLELKNKDLEEAIKLREQTFKDATKTQKELRTTKESLEAAHKKNAKLEKDLAKEKKEKEKELQVSFLLKQQVDKIQGKDDTIKTLKLKCLKSDFERKKDNLIQKRQDNEMLIDNLARMSNTESNSASSAAIRDAMDKLNAYSASLYSALDTLRVRYEERQQGIETAPASNHQTEVNFDVSSVGSPNLDSLELNTLRLLTTANFNTDIRPAQVSLVMNVSCV